MKAKKSLPETEQKDSEKALAATEKYKGTCTFCRKIGHKATDCYLRKNKEQAQADKKNNDKQKHARKGEWSEEKVQLYKDNKCFFCKKPGHKSQDCRERKTETVNATQETALMAMTMKAVSETTWIADSGATCHITNDLTGLYDIGHVETLVTLGDGTTVTAMMNAKLKLKMEGPEGPTTVTLYDVKYIPEFMLKLFSLSCAMKKGANIQNKGMILKV